MKRIKNKTSVRLASILELPDRNNVNVINRVIYNFFQNKIDKI